MRHLHFTQSLEPLQGGGLGTATAALHQEFLKVGISSVLCATHGGVPQKPAAACREFRRIHPGVLYYSPQLARECSNLVGQADVLHGHGLYVGTNYLFGREARRQAKPLVYHVHGMFEPYIRQRSRWKKRLVHWLFEDANTRHVRLWRALTNREAEQIRACGYRRPIVVAGNGLNLNHFIRPTPLAEVIQTPLAGPLRKQKKRLLFLARVHPKKGLDLLLHAWAQLGTLREDWELIIAGPDENGHLSQMRQLAASLQIDGEIIFTGTVTGEAKVNLFYSADAFVLPSYSEGMPMGLIEAMACAVPVIATQECNLPAITLAGAGWECRAELNSLTQTLLAALSADDTERRQRGANGRRLVEMNYSWSAITANILQACSAHCL
jgi:glycosyltransferase involved in cell wall biosynthesis